MLHDSIYMKYSRKYKLIYSDRKSECKTGKKTNLVNDTYTFIFLIVLKILWKYTYVTQTVYFQYIGFIIPQWKTHVNK